jgi:hypothetical protein
MDNEKVDYALSDLAKQVLREDNPDLLVVQFISVDQTGHARGSYNSEYLEHIESTDAIIEEFLGWCQREGYLENATVIITADHGQGIGIGGHGHMSRTEIEVPCILWGSGIQSGAVFEEPRSILDIAATVSYLLGAMPPEQCTGQVLPALIDEVAPERPVALIIPAHNEAENLPHVLAAVPRYAISDIQVIVVDDGSTDATSEVASQYGAIVVRHETNRGLGAALRTGLATARNLDARLAVYIDADGEYDVAQMPSLLQPILNGQADYVLGSRFRGSIEGMPLMRRIGNRILSLSVSVLTGHWISDGQTGFRAFSRRALETAEIVHDYNYAQVLSMDLLRKGMRLAEVPVSYRRRRHGRSFVSARYLWRVPLGMLRELFSQ